MGLGVGAWEGGSIGGGCMRVGAWGWGWGG